MDLFKDIPHYELYAQKTRNVAHSYFNIQRINSFTAKDGPDRHPHRHPTLHQVTWITKGSGTHIIDLDEHKSTPDTLYLLAPGVVHACENDQNIDGYVVHFSRDFPDKRNLPIVPEIGYQIVKVTSDQNQKEVNLIFEKIFQEFAEGRAGNKIMIESLLTMLLIHKARLISSKTSQNGPNSYHILTDHFKRLAEDNFRHERRITYYADLLCVSTTYLNDCIKKSTGLSAGAVIKERVILEAKRLLLFTRMNISEIAYLLGFNDRDYFWRYFNKHTHQSPGEFRKQYQLKSFI